MDQLYEWIPPDDEINLPFEMFICHSYIINGCVKVRATADRSNFQLELIDTMDPFWFNVLYWGEPKLIHFTIASTHERQKLISGSGEKTDLIFGCHCYNVPGNERNFNTEKNNKLTISIDLRS